MLLKQLNIIPNSILPWLFIPIAGVLSGGLIFFLLDIELSPIIVLIASCVLLLPLFIFYTRQLQKAAIAILVLSMTFIVDQTLNLHTNHVGGAQGYIISVNGMIVWGLLFLWLIQFRMNQVEPFQLFLTTTWPILGLLLLSIISIRNAVASNFSIYEFLELAKMFLIFLVFANLIRKKEYRSWILQFILIGLFIEGCIAILQYATDSTLGLKILGARATAEMSEIGASSVFRVSGTLGGVNELAIYFVMFLPIALALLLEKKNGLEKFILACIFLLGSLGLFFTYSRAGWFCLTLACLIVILFKILTFNIKYRLYLGIIGFFLITSLGVFIFGTENPIKNRFTADDKGSAYVRIPLMQVAFNIIQAHPFTGIGLNNYTEVHTYYDDTSENVTAHFPLPVHNHYLQLTAEVGIPALILYLGFLAFIFLTAFRLLKILPPDEKPIVIGMIAGLTGLLIQAMVENISIGHYTLMPLWFFSAWIVGLKKSDALNEFVR